MHFFLVALGCVKEIKCFLINSIYYIIVCMGAYIQFIKEKKNILKSITITCENLQFKNRIFKTEIPNLLYFS